MGVVIQKMVNSEVSGVMFSRNPINPSDRDSIVIESVYGNVKGLCVENLRQITLRSLELPVKSQKLVDKTNKYVQDALNKGIKLVSVSEEKVNLSTLSDGQIKKVSDLGEKIEKTFSTPMDIEWAMENDELYVVQMRPITTLPDLAFYNDEINGNRSILWDNSNIVESFAGVTTPLTFSLTKDAYAVVYKVTSRLVGVPEKVINDFDYAYTNMLGFIRGRVYYNLINWYKLLLIIPGFGSNQGFMETMMGSKRS